MMVFQCFVVLFAYFVEIRKSGIIPLFTFLRRKIIQNIFVGAEVFGCLTICLRKQNYRMATKSQCFVDAGVL